MNTKKYTVEEADAEFGSDNWCGFNLKLPTGDQELLVCTRPDRATYKKFMELSRDPDQVGFVNEYLLRQTCKSHTQDQLNDILEYAPATDTAIGFRLGELLTNMFSDAKKKPEQPQET